MTDHKKALTRVANKGARDAARNYINQHPEAGALRVRGSLNAYKPRSKEVQELPLRAAYIFLREETSRQMTNAQLAERLGTEIGQKLPSNILTERLKPGMQKQVQAFFDERRVTIDVTLHNSLSKIKKAIKAYGQTDGAEDKFEGRVTFSAKAVIVDHTAYPIQTDGRIHVGGRKLSVQALRLLLIP